MSILISLERLTEKIVDISQDLFEKYEKGIRADFENYMRSHYGQSIKDDIVDLSTLGTGIQALRKDYLTKSSSDYSAEDCAVFALEGHDRITAECMSVKSVEKLISSVMDGQNSIGNVYVKRNFNTGRLSVCVNRRAAEQILSLPEVKTGTEKQLIQAEAVLLNQRESSSEIEAVLNSSVIDLIAEKTAALVMKKMALSQAI